MLASLVACWLLADVKFWIILSITEAQRHLFIARPLWNAYSECLNQVNYLEMQFEFPFVTPLIRPYLLSV